jgi:ankyrin repeat protein
LNVSEIMSRPESLPFRASLEEYQKQAQALFDALKAGDEAAAWRFKWLHPRFRGKPVTDVRAATLELADAQQVVAHEYSFQTWAELAAFTEMIKQDGPVTLFETAVEAVTSGDLAALGEMLREHPELARARSARRHHATLLHYVAANGVEGGRQRTPANAVVVARKLLEVGSEADALADMYDEKCITMSMLVSSAHPAQAGLQGKLAELLLDYGARPEGRGSKWHSALMTALTFGYLDTAQTLAQRGAPVDNIVAAAGLGRSADVARLLPHADAESRHKALALAAHIGQLEVVRQLLDAGENPNRYNPEGFHSHSTPLHQAVCANHLSVVKLLVERGAGLDIRDTLFQATPLGWALHCKKPEITDYLRMHGAQD